MVDGESKKIEYARTATRIPEEERAQMVPWSGGGEDTDAYGELPEFDVKRGPGTRLTEGEKEDVRARQNLMIIHRAHLRNPIFKKFGFTELCGVCSDMFRGIYPQAHAPHC